MRQKPLRSIKENQIKYQGPQGKIFIQHKGSAHS